MRNYIELFKPNSTVMPFKPEQLNDVVKSTVSGGFVFCNYGDLISTIRDISAAKEYEITLNAEEIFRNSEDPTKNVNIVIQVEGDRINNLFDTHSITDNDNSLCTFDSYSTEFKSMIYDLKNKALKACICNYDALNSWACAENVAIAEDTMHNLCNDFEKFKNYITASSDIESFVEALPKELVNKYIKMLTVNGEKILKKFKNEVLAHFKNITKTELTIKVRNPIIVRIFALNGIANQCKTDWPQIPVVSIDRRAFDSLSWYI